ncbi:phenazine biosynthesis FMN-dependent oxidase PhzG [Streptomyces sp. NPDC047117]|uniref:phenazine biosynthesis FMN-dependent oxidase PhzG n=1 Tax=Streptomyces sp. NPDC047117 TaxID=3155379 RepID=UPI0033E6E29F
MNESAGRSAALTGDTTLELTEFDTPPAEPLDLLSTWLDSAAQRGVREPNAAVLATSDGGGRPSARVLLIKEFDGRGLVFGSARGSRKGRDLAERPWASLSFYWRETLQQLTVTGPVEVLSPVASDALFAARPEAARAASAVSEQSRPLTDDHALRARARDLLTAGGPVSRPEGWVGYRLVPESIEFWYGSPDRLHRRLRYDRAPDESWSWERLQP